MNANFQWIITDIGLEDLYRNIEYRIENSDYPEDSYQLVDAIASAMDFLCQVPYSGQLYVDFDDSVKNVYRYALRNGFVIYYRIVLQSKCLVVMRVLSTRQDQRSALGF